MIEVLGADEPPAPDNAAFLEIAVRRYDVAAVSTYRLLNRLLPLFVEVHREGRLEDVIVFAIIP